MSPSAEELVEGADGDLEVAASARVLGGLELEKKTAARVVAAPAIEEGRKGTDGFRVAPQQNFPNVD